MKQVFIKRGRAVIDCVPVPSLRAGTVLVRVDHSCISGGTEMSGLRASATPLWERALKKPSNVLKVMDAVRTNGLASAATLIASKLEAGAATGYSAAGTVMARAADVTAFEVGDRVACAGSQCAFHAEMICVPANLTVRIPDALTFRDASTVTMGAIALHGVRRLMPTLGETFVVFGLGALGQLAVQFLKTAGCKVIATDISRERLLLAGESGADLCLHSDDGGSIAAVHRFTGGFGVDGVIITAATSSDEVISKSFHMCRRKGRVSLVGDVGLNLQREDIYKKEIDFLISSSYGPGRYDPDYEERGFDYPIGYVRWTENRNMQEYLHLLASGALRLDKLITAVIPIEEATSAYELLEQGDPKQLLISLSYSGDVKEDDIVAINPRFRAGSGSKVRIAVIGAGGFANGMHLPNLQALSDSYQVQAIMSRTGHSAAVAAKQFNAKYSTTEFQRVLDDPEVDAVLIATRHDSHADLAMRALLAGKHTLVEKPLALNRQELSRFREFYRLPGQQPLLLTGFNRRFSLYGTKLKKLVRDRKSPLILNYRMNAGFLPSDHWVHMAEGGGRNIGEACHIYDLFTFLTGSETASVSTTRIDAAGAFSGTDNFVTTIGFADGSIAALTYTSMGSSQYPKEHLELFVEGKVAVMSDYETLVVHGAKGYDAKTSTVSKGLKEELVAFAKAVKVGGEWPIPLWQQFQAMEIAFEVEGHLQVDQSGESS